MDRTQGTSRYLSRCVDGHNFFKQAAPANDPARRDDPLDSWILAPGSWLPLLELLELLFLHSLCSFAGILVSDCVGASPSGRPRLFSGLGDSRFRIAASKDRDFAAECRQALRPHLCSLSCQCGAKTERGYHPPDGRSNSKLANGDRYSDC